MQALFLLPASPPPGLSVTGGRAELSRIAQFPRPVRPGAARLRTTLCAVLLTLVWAAPAHAQSAAPEITSETTFSVEEGNTAVETLTATDADADSLTWSIPTDGGDDAALFTLSNTGGLTFTTAPDYENPADADGDNVYAVTVQVSDGTNTDMATLEVTVENVIELATEITGPEDIEYAENQAVRVATYTASSAEDRAGITWILSGDDKDHFSIDTPPGVLRFHIDPDADNSFPKLPDYEASDDKDAKNDYEVIVLAQAGSAFPSPLRVTVTVTDENEAGAISLSPARPKAGSVLTATLTDPDGVPAGTVTWQWERSTGPNAWVVIAEAEAASYTPVAADTGAYLRATATYTDSHPADQTAQAVSAEVVTAHTLSRLEVTTSSSRSMYPAFDPEILHYAVGCQDTLTLTLSTDETDTRLAVNGIQRANQNVAVELTGLAGGSDIPITLTGSEGASTTYVLHCLADDFPAIITEKKPGAWDGLLTIGVRAPVGSYLAIIDNNGVPRIHWRIEERVRIFRTHRDGRYPYSYGQAYSRNVIVLDENMEPVDKVTTVRPIQHTDLHDFVIKSNGNYLLLAYESARRDMSQFTNSDGNPYSTTEDTRDSVIQEVTPDKEEAFNWNSWDHMAVEDCTQHRFPDDYAHVNSVQAFDDDIVASFRGCSKVLRIDGDSGDVIWRLGKSNRSDADWTASGIQPPLRIVGDPYGEFCGQHSARMIDNGNLLLFDNGVACLVDPEGNRTRPGEDFSRIVEYAIDPDHGEAIFQRHYSYHGEFNKLAPTQGHIELLETGNWLISWGSMPVNEQITEYSPLTGEEVLIVKLHVLGDSDRGLRTTAYPVSPDALAKQVAPLTAEIVTRAATSAFHTGSGTAQVVVAFSRPVKDFEKDTLPIQVTGATVTRVEPHIAVDAAANAYLVTLEPEGDGAISFALVTGRSCADGGICTADGTSLSGVPETAHTITIPGPVQVSFDEAAYTVTEGRTVEVVVELDGTHDRPGTLEIPLRVQSGGTDAGDTEYTVPTIVTFGPTETEKTVSVTTETDDIIEESEIVELGFGALPSGVKPGTTTTTRVTITDRTTQAELKLDLNPREVSEDDSAYLTVRITNGVTFATPQTFTLTFSGGPATQESDYAVDSDTLTLGVGQREVTTTLHIEDDDETENAETITVTANHDSGTWSATQTATIRASDQPAVTPRISIYAGRSPAEEAEGASFIVTRTGDMNAQLTVAVRVTQSGSIPLMGSPPSQVPFGVRQENVILNIPTEDDDIVEGETETSVVTAEVLSDTTNAPPLYLVGSPATAEVTVEDDDEAKFAVSVSPTTVTEGSTVQVIVTTIDDVTFASDQTLTLAFSGNAEQGTDYTVESDTLTLKAGESAVTTALDITNDGAKEPAETVRIAVQHDGKLFGSATLTIEASEDTKPPTLEEAEVPRAGRSLRLTFSEPLDEAEWHRPAATAFTVTVASEPREVMTVTVSGAQVVLELTSPVRPGQAVTVGYTMPAGHPAPPVLQDPAENAVESFPAEPVKNDSQFGRQPPGGPPGGGPPSGGGGGGPACTEDLHGNTAAQATGIALATETAGAICPAADVDYFTLTVPGRGLVFVDTTGVPTQGRIWQNDVVLASGPTGRQTDDRLGDFVDAGAVVVAVAGQGGATGDYEIVVTFSPGYLENPGHNSFQSGIGVISGWVCEAELVEIEIETERGETERYEAGYGTARADTAALPDGTPLCGDTDNGFGLLFNWNLLGAGEHEVVAYVDGMELDRATVTVTTVGTGEEEEFLRGVAGACVVEDFPMPGETVTLAWQETKQNFVITHGLRPDGTNLAGMAGAGYLENPGPNSFQSGVGVISGWVCEAETVEIVFETAQGGVLRYEAAYGTERADTAMQRKDGTPLCGDTDNGFGLLFNWNLLGEGEHTVVALVDEEELGRAVVRVTTVGTGDEEEFLRDVAGECTVADFPMDGQTTTLVWQQTSQNFVITDAE